MSVLLFPVRAPYIEQLPIDHVAEEQGVFGKAVTRNGQELGGKSHDHPIESLPAVAHQSVVALLSGAHGGTTRVVLRDA